MITHKKTKRQKNALVCVRQIEREVNTYIMSPTSARAVLEREIVHSCLTSVLLCGTIVGLSKAPISFPISPYIDSFLVKSSPFKPKWERLYRFLLRLSFSWELRFVGLVTCRTLIFYLEDEETPEFCWA